MNEKSSKPNETSSAEFDQQDENSVFDFLYYDVSRISSFLAQFDPSGSLTQIVTTERAHRGKRDSVSTQAGGSAGIVKGTFTDAADTTSEYGQQNNRTYDTRWANALGFLDYLQQRELLRQDLENSAIGDLVLFSGRLALFDLGMLRKVWDMPSMRKVIISAAVNDQEQSPDVSAKLTRDERRKLAKVSATSKNTKKTEAEVALELLSVLPHSIQASLSNDDASVWCTLREDSITISPSDLFMKHGMSIGEDWNIVGVMDALPDFGLTLSDGTPLEIVKQLVAGMNLGALAMMLGPSLVPAIRAMLGRPSSSFGFTPLLIFREISRNRLADGN